MWKYALAIGVISYFIHYVCEKKRIKKDGNNFGVSQIPLENIAATFCLGSLFYFFYWYSSCDTSYRLGGRKIS